MTLNWADLIKDAAETQNFDALPNGEYDLVVSEVKVGTTSTGKTMFTLKNQVTSGTYAKRLIWDRLIISPESKVALGIFFSKIRALGIPDEYFSRVPAPTPDEIGQVLTGRTFKGVVGSETYKDVLRNTIGRYIAVVGATPSIGGASFSTQPPPPVPAAVQPAPVPVATAAAEPVTPGAPPF